MVATDLASILVPVGGKGTKKVTHFLDYGCIM